MSRQIAELSPIVQGLCVSLLRKASKAGFPLVVVQTYRSFEEQEAIYAKGRTRPGEPCNVAKGEGSCQYHPMGLTVTNARAGDSWHNYRAAFDVCFLKGSGQVSWEGPWEQLGELGESIGLEWGGRWRTPDRPHFEYHPGLTLAEAKKQASVPEVQGA